MTTSYHTQVLNAPANADAHSSDGAPVGIGKWLPSDEVRTMSFHVVATSIDAADGVVFVECSNLPDPTVSTTPPAKTDATETLAASGEYMISLSANIVTERWYRVSYTHGTNSTGTIAVHAQLKG